MRERRRAVRGFACMIAGLMAASVPACACAQPGRTAAGAAKAVAEKARAASKAGALVPLTGRERAEQMLNRFTFGARPGQVDEVLALGPDVWFEQQLKPEGIKDPAWSRRQGDFPTLSMSSEQALAVYADRGMIQQVADGKRALPADPLLAGVYEVQVAKLHAEEERRRPDASGKLPLDLTEGDKQSAKEAGQASAVRVAGQLFSLAKKDRMAALLKMPVEDRIAFTQYLAGDQRAVLFNDFNPRQREAFNEMASDIGAPYRIGEELAQAKMVRAVLTERQLQDVMTDFWFNHFNVYAPKDSDQWYTTAYERDAIRKNALGKFSELLLATAQHPAMLVYLDNWLSIGPDSVANGVNPANPKSKAGNKGLNENYGREVMELHTVGVNGGYTQADVTSLAAILTGWTVANPGAAGGFQYDPKKHEPGSKMWMGHVIGGAGEVAGDGSSPGGMREGLEALNLLAHRPETAHFICWKLAQRFVADDPPAALVDRMSRIFLASDGDIRALLRALAQSPEFNSRRYFRTKVKTPLEFLVSAYRATATEPSNPGALVNAMRSMGMELYHALPPTGYSITADHWMNSTALVDRLNFADQLTSGRFGGQRFDAAHGIGLAVMGGAVDGPAGSSDLALRVSESTMTGGEVSKQTTALIRTQLAKTAAQGSSESELLNLMTGLLLGSPEFQVH